MSRQTEILRELRDPDSTADPVVLLEELDEIESGGS